MTTILDDVTIRLDAAYDLRAAGLPEDEADDLTRAYREAAAAICDGMADVLVVEAIGDSGVGCDAEWAEEFGLWQAAHDCCRRIDGRWIVNAVAVERARKNLARWVASNVCEPPVMVEVASCDETIRTCGGLEDYAGLEHPAIHEACEAYHRAATDALLDAGRLNWCVPSGQRVLHSGWMGARFAYSSGAIGTMATDLTDEEKAAISAADDAGREAARKVIEAADAAARA